MMASTPHADPPAHGVLMTSNAVVGRRRALLMLLCGRRLELSVSEATGCGSDVKRQQTTYQNEVRPPLVQSSLLSRSRSVLPCPPPLPRRSRMIPPIALGGADGQSAVIIADRLPCQRHPMPWVEKLSDNDGPNVPGRRN